MIDATVIDQKEIQAGDHPILAMALRYLAAGLCPLPTPVGEGKLKRPDPRRVPSWEKYTRFRPPAHYVRRWFAGIPQGVCLVTGKVSDYLKVLDFDDHGGQLGNTFQRWAEIVREGSPDLYDRLYIGQTPGDGYRVAFRCEAATGYKTQLAMAAEKDCLIELLDDGHVVMVPGGDPQAHPSGRPYTTVQGDLLDLPMLTAEEQRMLIRAAKQLNRWTKPEEPVAVRPVRPVRPVTDLDEEHQGDRPGDQFNATADWEDILTPHGWSFSHHQGEIQHWTRPGKEPAEGASATTNYAGSNLLHCFSANAHPFEPDRSYTAFAAHTLLNHDGNFAAAARQLAEQYAEQHWGGDPAPGSPAALIRAGKNREQDPDPPPSEDDPQPEQPRGRRGFRLDELDGLPPARWLIRSHLTEGSMACMYGPSGGGKSFLAIEMAMSVAAGRPYLGTYDTRQGPVVYLSGEGTAGLGCRFKAWLEHHGRERPRNLLVVPYQFDCLDRGEVEELLALIGRDLGERPSLVVLDTVNRYFGGGDENDTRDMTTFVRAVDRIRRATGSCVLVVHHTGKDPTRGERGNSALRAATDTMLMCDDSAGGSLVACTKQKEAVQFDRYVVKRVVVALGPDRDGEDITSCVLEPQDQGRTAYQLLKKQDKGRVNALWDQFGAGPFNPRDGGKAAGLSDSGASRAFRTWAERGVLERAEGRYCVSAAAGRCIRGAPGR